MRLILSLLMFVFLSCPAYAVTWVRSHLYVDGEVLTAANLNTSINEGVNVVNDLTGANLDSAIAITSSGTQTFTGTFNMTGNSINIGNSSSTSILIKDPNGIEYSNASTWTFNGDQTVSGTWADLGHVTTIDLNGGTIDGTTIGSSSPGTGKFTTLNTTGNVGIGTTSLTAPLVVAGNVGINSTSPGQALDVQGTVRATNFTLQSTNVSVVPSGVIVMWSGTIANIPSGWHLCDGTNGTPDLRNFFVVGAYEDSSGVAKTTITGSDTLSGNGSLPATNTNTANFMTSSSGSASGYSFGGVAQTVSANQIGASFTPSFGTGSYNIARYYALAYIMKL